MSTATLTLNRYFNGEHMGSRTRRVTLTAKAIIAALQNNSGDGWGCRVEMTAEQLAVAGGYVGASGFGVLALPSGYKDDRIDIVRPAHRPRRDPAAARVVRSYRLHPATITKLDAEAKRSGESAGQVIDRLVQGLDHG